MPDQKRKLLGAERLGGKTLAMVAGMAVAASVAIADMKNAEASIPAELVTSSTPPAAPGTLVLAPAATSGEQMTYHRSHMSHQSHQSHYSHYSSRGY